LKAMRARAAKGVSRFLHLVFGALTNNFFSQLLSEEEKAILAAEEVAARDKKDCVIM